MLCKALRTQGGTCQPQHAGAGTSITGGRQSLHQHLSILRIFKGHLAASEALASDIPAGKWSRENRRHHMVAEKIVIMRMFKSLWETVRNKRGTLKGPAKERMLCDHVFDSSLAHHLVWTWEKWFLNVSNCSIILRSQKKKKKLVNNERQVHSSHTPRGGKTRRSHTPCPAASFLSPLTLPLLLDHMVSHSLPWQLERWIPLFLKEHLTGLPLISP